MVPPPANTLETHFRIHIIKVVFLEMKQQFIKNKTPWMANGHVYFLQNVHIKVEHIKHVFPFMGQINS